MARLSTKLLERFLGAAILSSAHLTGFWVSLGDGFQVSGPEVPPGPRGRAVSLRPHRHNVVADERVPMCYRGESSSYKSMTTSSVVLYLLLTVCPASAQDVDNANWTPSGEGFIYLLLMAFFGFNFIVSPALLVYDTGLVGLPRLRLSLSRIRMGLLRLVLWKQIHGVSTRVRLQMSQLIKDTGEPLASQIYLRSRFQLSYSYVSEIRSWKSCPKKCGHKEPLSDRCHSVT